MLVSYGFCRFSSASHRTSHMTCKMLSSMMLLLQHVLVFAQFFLLLNRGAYLAMAGKMTGTAAERKAALIQRHLLFGRRILRAELPALARLVRAAWNLPISPDLRVAYLIQGEEDTTSKEEAMWSASVRSDCYRLTFRRQRNDSLFFPDSRLAEGRNVLLAAAAVEELRAGIRYRYYIMLDADVYASQPWTESLRMFEAFLADWEPAVGVPAYGEAKSAHEPYAIYHFDHIFLAIHAEAAPSLLPYRAELDVSCAWTSQWVFGLLAQALYRKHTLTAPSVRVYNPKHGEYPKENCYQSFKDASKEYRDKAPDHARYCFPDPTTGRWLFAQNWLQPQELEGMQAYIPWAEASRKSDSTFTVDYAAAALGDIEPCEENMANVQQYAQFRSYRFCPLCPPEAILYLLQTTIADNPLWGPNWHELGVMAWGLLGDVPLARGCVEIARRLEELRDKSILVIYDLIDVLDTLLRSLDLNFTADQFLGRALWQEEGRSIVEKVVRIALLSVHLKDEADPLLLSEAEVYWFVTFLIEGDQSLLNKRPPRRPTPLGLLL